jgi:FolB domain-containing protein
MHRDRIIIRDLLTRGILGIHPEERVQPQDILLNIIIYKDLGRAAATGDLGSSVDYAAVTRRVIGRIEGGEDQLAETLAEDIARLIIAEFGADGVRVRVEKPAAVPAARTVGVEIERSAADSA